VSAPTADLSKLRINRDDPPPAVKRALGRVLWLVAAAVVIIAIVVAVGRRDGVVPVQVVTVSTSGEGGRGTGEGSGGSVALVANGYVVARTKAAVSAKIPGRLAVLNVSGGSTVQKGDIIARLDNADYAAAVGGVTPLLLLLGLIFAVVMGVVGGFFPALRAARLQVVQALR